MKKVFFVLAMAISISAPAAEVNLSEDAAKLANVLLDLTNVQDEAVRADLKELKQYAYIDQVIVNEMEDLTIYKLSGTGIWGGDMACGRLTLEIQRTHEFVQPPNMFNPYKITYKTKLDNPCKGR